MHMPSNAETGAYQQEYKKKMFYYETEQVRVHGFVLMKFFFMHVSVSCVETSNMMLRNE
jgi:hypothetical protein